MLFNKNKTTKVLNVEKMHCGNCAAKVKNALKEIKVTSEVNLANKTVTVRYNSEKITIDEIKATINKLGFEVV